MTVPADDLPAGTLLVLPRAVWEKSPTSRWRVTGIRTPRSYPGWRAQQAIDAGATTIPPTTDPEK